MSRALSSVVNQSETEASSSAASSDGRRDKRWKRDVNLLVSGGETLSDGGHVLPCVDSHLSMQV